MLSEKQSSLLCGVAFCSGRGCWISSPGKITKTEADTAACSGVSLLGHFLERRVQKTPGQASGQGWTLLFWQRSYNHLQTWKQEQTSQWIISRKHIKNMLNPENPTCTVTKGRYPTDGDQMLRKEPTVIYSMPSLCVAPCAVPWTHNFILTGPMNTWEMLQRNWSLGSEVLAHDTQFTRGRARIQTICINSEDYAFNHIVPSDFFHFIYITTIPANWLSECLSNLLRSHTASIW